jgi:RHS repeat-associated protein
MRRAVEEHTIDTSLARCGLTVLLTALAVACGDSSGPGGSGERTAVTAEAVSLSITLANEVGRLVSGGNGLARAYYAYDTRGRTTAVEHVLDNTPYVFTSTYGFQCSSSACTATTAAANGPVLVAATFPGSQAAGLHDTETVTYTFDAGSGAQSIVTTPWGGTAQTVVSKMLRNSRGQTVEVDYGDLTNTVHHYNDTTDMRLNEIETYVAATPTTVLQLYQYAFDGMGNVTVVTDNCNESSTGACSSSQENSTYSATYSYDSRDELVQTVRKGVTYPYGYDSIGNVTNMEGATQAYFPSGAGKPRPHALESVGSVIYQYDANGNTTGTTGASTNASLTWNAENMPVATAYGSNTTSKSFVGESMWRKVVVAGSSMTTTYYLPSMRVENGAYRKYFGTFAERDINDTSSCPATTGNAAEGCLKFYHGDHLGSSTAVTNGSSTVVHRQAYTPYGEDIVTPAPGPFTPKYQFNFRERESDGTGFYDYGARIYNPATGRWLSPDSSTKDGLNRYTYVRNNPLFYNDLTGHGAGQTALLIVGPSVDGDRAEQALEDRGVHVTFRINLKDYAGDEKEAIRQLKGVPAGMKFDVVMMHSHGAMDGPVPLQTAIATPSPKAEQAAFAKAVVSVMNPGGVAAFDACHSGGLDAHERRIWPTETEDYARDFAQRVAPFPMFVIGLQGYTGEDNRQDPNHPIALLERRVDFLLSGGQTSQAMSIFGFGGGRIPTSSYGGPVPPPPTLDNAPLNGRSGSLPTLNPTVPPPTGP